MSGRCNTELPPSPEEQSWAVVGGSGFVGQGIVDELRRFGVSEVRVVRSPRLRLEPSSNVQSIVDVASSDGEAALAVLAMTSELRGIDVVVNAAGLATPDADYSPELWGANSLLPVVLAEAAAIAGARRLVHLSSAAVQGRKTCLDETAFTAPFSAYSEAKAAGEGALRAWDHRRDVPEDTGWEILDVVIVRATSVQGMGRATSNSLARIASSRLASVAAPGTQPSVVSSLSGLSSLVVAVGSHQGYVPEIVLQPWEGASVSDVLHLASGGKAPVTIPAPLARVGVVALYGLGRILPPLKGLARRLEVMWFGQDQVVSWAVQHGLAREVGADVNAKQRVSSGAIHRGPSLELRRLWGGLDVPPLTGGSTSKHPGQERFS